MPAGGTLYLNIGQVNCLTAGATIDSAMTLVGISIRVNVADGSRDYDVEVVKNSSGSPSVLGSALTLASGNVSAQRSDLNAAVALGDELGVRLVLSDGSGRSDFRHIVVLVRLKV